MFTFLTAVLTIASLVGVVLNIKKNHYCFYIWLVTNASWAVIDFYKNIPMQGILFTIYTSLAIYGIYEWKFKDENNKTLISRLRGWNFSYYLYQWINKTK